ncbi:MAG TPA: cell division protein SepF [Acidimicrobiales bacterium]
MASMWRKAMLYLGLGPDEEYEDYDLSADRPVAAPTSPERWPAAPPQHDPEPSGSVRTLTSTTGETGLLNGNGTQMVRHEARAGAGPPGGARHERTARRDPEHPPRRRPAAVPPRGGARTSKPHVVGPTSFNDAQEVADKFKESVPVILNLQGVERDLARRIIDFASGLCYGLAGQMERVATQVYLLTPSDVEVSAEDRRRLHERGYEA